MFEENGIEEIVDDFIVEKENDLTSEQWNKIRYSMREILQENYLNFIVEQRGLEIEYEIYSRQLRQNGVVNANEDKNSGEGITDEEKVAIWKKRRMHTVLKEIDYMLYYEKEEDDDSEECVDLEHYIQYRRIKLFEMLDVIIENSREKLHSSEKNVYKFNILNHHFIYTLISLYDEKNINCSNLLKGKYYELEEEFLKFLYVGLLELAENEETQLSKEDFIERWKMLFSPHYREICSIVEDLKANIFYYVGAIPEKEENEPLYKEIKDKLLNLSDEIVKMTKGKMEFPDLDFEEMQQYMENQRKSRQLRSERAKEQWRKKQK